MKRLLGLTSLFISVSTFATQAPISLCGADDSFVTKATVNCLIQELVSTQFPSLEDAYAHGRILYREFHSDQYFLKTAFLKGALNSNPEKKLYSVDVNPKIYSDQAEEGDFPTVAAIRGILAHELMHVKDYENDRILDLLKIGFEMVVRPPEYERYTDERAFELGYADDLKQYRIWLYRQLTPKALKIKMKRYYTPEQIANWESEHT